MSTKGTRVQLGFQMDEGRVRQLQEDSCIWYDPGDDRDTLARKGRLYVVADGMGGYAAGEVASKLAVNTIAQAYQADPDPDVPASLLRAIDAANSAIYQQSQSGTNAGMGTTVVCAVVRGDELFVAHVGDSRAYLLQGDELRQIMRDHTLVNELLLRNAITPEQARAHPDRHVLSRALGKKASVTADVGEPWHLQSGDMVLLCSDGISGYLSDEQIEFDLRSSLNDPQAAAEDIDPIG